MHKYSEHFSDQELSCHCCGTQPDEGVSDELLRLLENIRAKVSENNGEDTSISISCAYRCPAHNAEVGGVENSYHVQGLAADVIVPDGMSVDGLAEIAEECGADGIGRYYNSDFVHVDVRGYAARWSDRD